VRSAASSVAIQQFPAVPRREPVQADLPGRHDGKQKKTFT